MDSRWVDIFWNPLSLHASRPDFIDITESRPEKSLTSKIKKSGGREEYSREKIEKSLHLACNKRPVSEEIIQKTIDVIEEQIYNSSNVEIDSSLIGELIIEKLRSIDKVAFIRFASVYRQFHDLGEFQAQLDDLKNK